MRISDWSSDVCSSDLGRTTGKISVIARATETHPHPTLPLKGRAFQAHAVGIPPDLGRNRPGNGHHSTGTTKPACKPTTSRRETWSSTTRSDEHTSELQSLMRISYAVFCLQNKMTKHLSPIPQQLTYRTPPP